MKKQQQYLLMVLMVTFIAVGCGNKKSAPMQQPIVTAEEETTTDSTVYGVCGDGTAMHTLQVITDSGDTIDYMLNADGELVSDVQGGKMVGDRVAVIGTTLNSELVAKKVINLTTLLGKWMSLDKKFEIQEGGMVHSFLEAESHPWTAWKIVNGNLVLNKDTFNIINLGADSLYLENKEGIFAYKRQK